MKLLISLLLLGFLTRPEARLMLIDRNLKQPAVYANDFNFDQYVHRTFPLYVQDLPAVIEAAEKAAKRIEQGIGCNEYDTVDANHTRFIIYADCQRSKMISVRLVTKIEEQKIWCDFELIRKQDNNRKAQRQLLDFSTYLAK